MLLCCTANHCAMLGPIFPRARSRDLNDGVTGVSHRDVTSGFEGTNMSELLSRGLCRFHLGPWFEHLLCLQPECDVGPWVPAHPSIAGPNGLFSQGITCVPLE